jgi:hypothetical protein
MTEQQLIVPPPIAPSDMDEICAELCRAGGSAGHPQLRHDVRSAVLTAVNSPALRRLVAKVVAENEART